MERNSSCITSGETLVQPESLSFKTSSLTFKLDNKRCLWATSLARLFYHLCE